MYRNLCAWALPHGPLMSDESSLKEIMKLAKSSGFEGLEIDMQTIARIVEEKSLQYVKDLISESGLIPAAWNLPDMFWEADYELSWRSNEDRYRRLLERLPVFAEIGSEIGCGRVYTWPVSYSDEMDFMTNFRWHVARLKPVSAILRYYGCRLGLEWMAPRTCRAGHRYDFVRDMDGALALAEAIDIETVGLLLDSWHWHISGNTVDDILKLRPEQVVYIHFNDAPAGVPMDEFQDLKRAVAGETGVIDLVGFLKALKAIGYDGPIEPCAPGAVSLDGKSVQEAAEYSFKMLTKVMQAAGCL